MNNPYVPILALFAIGAGFAMFSLVAGSLSGPKRYNRAKLDAYECGVEPTPHAIGGGRFPVKYYLTAMLFIVFDIEGVFLFPFAVAFSRLGIFALVEMVLFIVTVFVAYAYVFIDLSSAESRNPLCSKAIAAPRRHAEHLSSCDH
jgi:NADH-quinone oxidoreductase subunit A